MAGTPERPVSSRCHGARVRWIMGSSPANVVPFPLLIGCAVSLFLTRAQQSNTFADGDC